MHKAIPRFLKSETAWNYSAVAAEFIGTALLGILQSMLVVRVMPQAEYGQYSFTITLLSYTAFVSSWAMMFLAVKEYSQRTDQAPRILAGIVQTRLIVTLPLGLFLVFIPGLVPESSSATNWVVAFSYLGLLINCLSGDLIYLFMSLNRQRTGALLGIIGSVIYLMALYAVHRLPIGISQQSVAGASLVSPLITTFIGLRIARRMLGVDSLNLFRPQWDEIRNFLRNGLALLPGRVAVQIYTTIAMIFAGIYLTLDDVAVFRVGAAFATYITGAAFLSARITSPALTREAVNLGTEKFKHAAYQHTYYLCLVAFGAIVGTYGFGGWLLEMVYGTRYRSSETVTFWIVFQLLGMAMLNGASTILYARGMNKQSSLILMSGVVAGALGGWLLIPALGVVGAGMTICLIQAVVHLSTVPFLPADCRWFWFKPSMLPLLCMTAALGVIALLKTSMPHSNALPLLGLGVLAAYFCAAGWPLIRKLTRDSGAASTA
jgi:O-antigen/teichoic acid export membrane protein